MKLTDVLNYDLVQFGFRAADKKEGSDSKIAISKKQDFVESLPQSLLDI